jgi:hypothetical protein
LGWATLPGIRPWEPLGLVLGLKKASKKGPGFGSILEVAKKGPQMYPGGVLFWPEIGLKGPPRGLKGGAPGASLGPLRTGFWASLISPL